MYIRFCTVWGCESFSDANLQSNSISRLASGPQHVGTNYSFKNVYKKCFIVLGGFKPSLMQMYEERRFKKVSSFPATDRNDIVRNDPRFQLCMTIVDMFSNMVIEITETCTSDWVQLGRVKLSFISEFAIGRHFQNVFCFSACSDQILVNFHYGFWARPSVNVICSGVWSFKTTFFDAKKGTTF